MLLSHEPDALPQMFTIDSEGGAWIDLPLDEDKYYEMLQEKIANSKLKKEVKETVFSTEGTY